MDIEFSWEERDSFREVFGTFPDLSGTMGFVWDFGFFLGDSEILLGKGTFGEIFFLGKQDLFWGFGILLWTFLGFEDCFGISDFIRFWDC